MIRPVRPSRRSGLRAFPVLALFLALAAAAPASGQPEDSPEAGWRALLEEGAAAVRAGDLARARELFERAAAAEGADDPQAHLRRAAALNNLGYVLHRLGRLEEAEAAYREALELRRAVTGEDDPGIARILQNLAEVARSRGQTERAEELHRRALELHRRLLGGEHPDTARTLVGLAALEAEHGDHAAARGHLLQALANLEKSLGPDHPEVVATLSDLAAVAAAAGDLEEAERRYREALERAEKAGDLPPERRAALLVHLAEVLRRAGRGPEAVELLEQALELLPEDGRPSALRARVENDLGVNLFATGDLERAAEVLGRAVERCRGLGDVPPELAVAARANLAGVLTALGRHAEAAGLLDEALALERRGRNDPRELARLLNDRAVALFDLGRRAEAADTFREALEAAERAFGPEDPALAPHLTNLATALRALGREEEAARVEARLRALGGDALRPGAALRRPEAAAADGEGGASRPGADPR